MGPAAADNTGRIGVHGVAQLVHRELGWKFREQHESDVGVDALVEVVERERALGRLLALQIKAGRSWFREPAPSPGWVFRGSRRHLTYWLDHDLPVLVVLYDDDLQVGYWQHVTAATVEQTGAGFKLVVPAANRLDASAAEPLRELVSLWPSTRPTGERPRPGPHPSSDNATWRWISDSGHPLPRVADVTDRALLGVHPAIALPPGADARLSTDLPTYVARDVDPEVRAAVAAASREGGFLLLVGVAAAGKTRCLFEAVRSVLPTWRMLIPESVSDLASLVVTGVPLGHTVVWLDNLESFLGPGGLTARLVRQLRADPAVPTVITGTLSPAAYEQLSARPATQASGRGLDASTEDPPVPLAHHVMREAAWPAMNGRRWTRPDPQAPDLTDESRRVLDLVSHRIYIARETSSTERARAEAVAATDPRIAEALRYRTDLGLGAVLAATPDLVQRLLQPDPALGRELLNAAVDARRFGHPEPIPADLLRGLTEQVYLTGAQRATATPEWFATAVESARRPVRGASPPMWPTSSRVGQIDGYVVTDILVQHQPASLPEPAVEAAWNYLASHADPPVCFAIGAAAHEAQHLQAAEVALRRGAEAGHHKAMNNLGVFLDRLGDRGGARTWLQRVADGGDLKGMYNLARLEEKSGDLETAERWYRQAADAGHDVAMFTLGYLAHNAGDLDAAHTWYQAAVDTGYTDALTNLATVLDARGDTDAAIRCYIEAIDAGSTLAMFNLGILLTKQGDTAAAVRWYARAAEAGNTNAMFNLGHHMAEAGDTDGGADWLRRAAEAGHRSAANNLAVLLQKRGDTEQARTWFENAAQAGDTKAMNNLGELLERDGDGDAARHWYQRALAEDDPRAKYHLGAMAARDGDLQPLRTWFLDSLAADSVATLALGHLLAQLGELDTLREGLTRAFASSNTAAIHLGILLAVAGDTSTVEASFHEAMQADNEGSIVAMAWMLVRLGYSDVARAWFRDAVEGNDMALTAVLGWALYDGDDPEPVRTAIQTLTEKGHDETAEQLRLLMKATDDFRSRS
jgi:TPR repeat protein